MNLRLLRILLTVATTLGTAWAVRGQFGHEQGAAWAGGIGTLCILVIARRPDWNANLFGITLAGAVGWGLGGMMSYGLLVGYGHGDDVSLVGYSLAMLFVVGALYGFLGGGLFGLALTHSRETPVNWFYLAVLMIAGGALTYAVVISLLNWRMTPPRSEAWAVCLGFALTLTAFLLVKRKHAVLRIALFTALGAGFGFAFGNVLHAYGLKSGIPFNFWNVMEYSLGFFGGLGMAYGTFTTHLPAPSGNLEFGKAGQIIAWLVLGLVIPLKVWLSSFGLEKLRESLARPGLNHLAGLVHYSSLMALVFVFIAGTWLFFFRNRSHSTSFTSRDTGALFPAYFLFYILLSLWVTGSFFSSYRIEQYLYPINFALVLLLLRRFHLSRSADEC